jgi:hypothetical protein
MAAIPKIVEKRIRDGIKKYKNVLKTAKDKDINEADTVTIVFNILVDICGYDRFLDLTKECAIKGTFCDIGIKLDNKKLDNNIVFLIEVKAVGINLKESHLKQAIHYASDHGTEWAILTNGDHWQVHKIIFGRPIKTELALDFRFLETDKISNLISYFFLLSKEVVKKIPLAIDVYHEERQLTSRYMIAQLIQTDPFIDLIRKKLKSLSKKLTITNEDISNTLKTQVLKREVLEGEHAENAMRILGHKKNIERAKVDKRGVSSFVQGKDDLRYQFWTQLLALAQEKTDLHAKIKPTKYDWLGRRIYGLWFNYSVGQHLGRAELWIDKGKGAEAENKEIFDKLVANKAEIEHNYGGPLEWERLDGKRACRIRKQIDLGGYLDEQTWPKLHEAMVDAMIHLHKALSPHIQYLSS